MVKIAVNRGNTYESYCTVQTITHSLKTQESLPSSLESHILSKERHYSSDITLPVDPSITQEPKHYTEDLEWVNAVPTKQLALTGWVLS